MKIAAVTDLGGLGAAEGPGVLYNASLPSRLPAFLPWLLVPLLFLLKANRRAQAWWILLPFGLVAGGCEITETLLDLSDSSGQAMFLEIFLIVAFGLTVVWLLAPYLRRSLRLLTFLLALPVMAATNAGVFLLRNGWDSGWSQTAPIITVSLLCAVALSLALSLTGWSCRRRFNWLRCSLWLLGWLTAVWLVVLGVVVLISQLTHSDGPELWQFGLAVLLATGLSFGITLPFLVLSLVNGFYRERFQRFLHAEPPVPPVIAAPPPASATA